MRLPELRSWFVAVLQREHGCDERRPCDECQARADALTASWRERFRVESG